jgi:isocitrate dehydrogenase kinase/phosphatase
MPRPVSAGGGRAPPCDRAMATPIPSAASTAAYDASNDQARRIARVLLEGFDHHYAVFRECARAAKRHFEAGNWLAIQHVARDRIDFYDRRAQETAANIERDHQFVGLDGAGGELLWELVKLNYIGLLIEHKQPECAETFFNSVVVKTLRRGYFHNRFIFVRPTLSTEHIDADPPSYRSYYPLQQGLRHALIDIVLDFRFERRFANFGADLRHVIAAFRRRFPRPFRLEANHQIQVLSSPFFRNQTAYIVGRVINGAHAYPFVVPIKHDAAGRLYFDALIMDDVDLAILFSANRAYFLVDMEVPAAYIGFLRAILPDKTAAELYTMVGLQKAGKNFFFRDFLHHLKHSRDRFAIAPGIKGLVMTVFTLPSYPYVFKVIRDKIAASKDTDRQKVKQQYWLVKHHDRVGRMTDTLEYSDVAFPRERFSDELVAELTAVASSELEFDGDYIVIRHLYIERRMIPLNLYLERADDEQRAHVMHEYGNALRELAAVNIFAGDLLFKNFGVTRFGRVVFYDYDEIEYLTSCNFRRIPPPPPGWDDMSDDIWYVVGRHDVFPEEFETFLLTDPKTRECFRKFHAELLDARWWQAMQEEIRSDRLVEVLSYDDSVRFPQPVAPRPAAEARAAD